MHLRRALLLFAIVLGLAALVAAVSRPVEGPRSRERSRDLPAAEPRRAPARVTHIEFAAGKRRPRRRLAAGEHAIVTVEVERPGQVEIAGLGLSSAAEPRTPARFDVLADRPGSHDVVFTPAGSDARGLRGTLAIRTGDGRRR